MNGTEIVLDFGEWEKLEEGRSSNITAVRYQSEQQWLFVRFKNGGEYAYLDVTQAEYLNLVEAESIGRFLNGQIKPGHGFVRVPDNVDLLTLDERATAYRIIESGVSTVLLGEGVLNEAVKGAPVYILKVSSSDVVREGTVPSTDFDVVAVPPGGLDCGVSYSRVGGDPGMYYQLTMAALFYVEKHIRSTRKMK